MLKNLFKSTTTKQNGNKPEELQENEKKIKQVEEEEENEKIQIEKEENKEEEIPELPIMCLDDFELYETIGTGTFGKVKVCQLKKTKEFYAIKILKKKEF